MVNKLTRFQSFVYSFEYNIFGICETWLSHYILDKEILPHGYNIYRKDRDTRGGGVLLAVNNKFTTSQMSSPPDLELISARIHEPS